MTRGDLILYRSTGRWYERLITLATHGPYTHVAIVADTTSVSCAIRPACLSAVIAADTQGIRYDALPHADDMHTVVSLAPYATPDGIERGMAWAEQQRGRKYGWLDVVYQGVKFLWPGNPLRFGIEGHYDCSDFACRYLIHAGVAMPDDYLDSYTVTPNDLARWAGLLAPRKAA